MYQAAYQILLAMGGLFAAGAVLGIFIVGDALIGIGLGLGLALTPIFYIKISVAAGSRPSCSSCRMRWTC
jgi:hypothetical protein